MPQSTIVTNEMLAELGDRLKELDQVDREIMLAKRAGIPVEAAESKARELRQQLVQIKQTYGVGAG